MPDPAGFRIADGRLRVLAGAPLLADGFAFEKLDILDKRALVKGFLTALFGSRASERIADGDFISGADVIVDSVAFTAFRDESAKFDEIRLILMCLAGCEVLLAGNCEQDDGRTVRVLKVDRLLDETTIEDTEVIVVHSEPPYKK